MAASNSSFVSQRASAVMWELVPEPGSMALFGLGAMAMGLRRRH
jgi:hypothetical protein